jgi:hypothetical protein
MSPRSPRAAAFAACVVLVFAQGASARRAVAVAGPAPVVLAIGEGTYTYLPIRADSPLVFSVQGPAVFAPIMRWRFGEDRTAVDVEVAFSLDGSPLWRRVFRARAGEATYPDEPGLVAGEAVREDIDVPSGEHIVRIVLVAPRTGTLDVNPVVRTPSTLPWRAEWRAEVGAAYDSNIFRYSDDDVEDFLDGRRRERFPFEYMDDLRLEPSLDLSFVREQPGRRRTDLRLSADYRLAAVNTDKSFAKLGAGVSESEEGLGRASLEYYAIPRYYIRDLWDPDADGGYRSCEFSKYAVKLGGVTDFAHVVNLEGSAQYDRSDYGPDFVEYDADAWTTGLTAIVRPFAGLRLDGAYAFRRSVARGYDEVGESRETSDDSDASYQQDTYSLRSRWDLARLRRGAGRGLVPAVLVLGGRLDRRFYSTDRSPEDDPYHAGREDSYVTLWLRGAWRLTDATTLEGFYALRTRSAESTFNEEIGALKDYTAHRVGVRLIFEGERFLD